jgi:hypothetical protein
MEMSDEELIDRRIRAINQRTRESIAIGKAEREAKLNAEQKLFIQAYRERYQAQKDYARELSNMPAEYICLWAVKAIRRLEDRITELRAELHKSTEPMRLK